MEPTLWNLAFLLRKIVYFLTILALVCAVADVPATTMDRTAVQPSISPEAVVQPPVSGWPVAKDPAFAVRHLFAEYEYIYPLKFERYKGQHAKEFEQMKPVVSQGGGILLSNGQAWSGGFSRCVAFVIRNPLTGMSGLFHIQDFDFEVKHQQLLKEFFLEWLKTVQVDTDQKQKLANAIADICFYKYPHTMKREEVVAELKNLGIDKIQTALFGGDSGNYVVDIRLRESLLSFLGVKLPPTVIFPDFMRHWEMIADFDRAIVKILIKFKRQVLIYPMFPTTTTAA